MISFQFSAEANIPTLLIEWYGHGCWSHVDVMLDGKLLGARINGGVQLREPGYAKFSRTKQVDIPSTPQQLDHYALWLMQQVGKPYDMTAIMAFAANRNWQEDDSWFCSELTARGLEIIQWFPYPLSVPSNKITPPDFMLLLSARANVSP